MARGGSQRQESFAPGGAMAEGETQLPAWRPGPPRHPPVTVFGEDHDRRSNVINRY